MSTQMIGLSMGGILRRLLVNPPSMSASLSNIFTCVHNPSIIVWPANLVTCAVFNMLHAQGYTDVEKRGISRERFFFYAWAASVIWYIIPGYLFRALSYFSWVCWIAPNNIIINQLFGYFSGLGMSIITFDWSQIAFIGSPLATPWWVEANLAGGFVFFFCKSK